MEESLVRPEFRRRRRWTGVAIAIAIPAQLATLYGLLLRPDRTTYITTVERIETTQVVTVPSPPIIVMPAAAPSTPTLDTRACPTPRTDAPRFIPPELPEEMTGLAVSRTNAGWIAAWNDNHVFVSTDAGRTFERVLDGPGFVHAAQFDCFGHVVVSRGDQIGVADGGRETWHAITGLDLVPQGEDREWQPNVGLVGGGRDIIAIGPRTGDQGGARLAVSRDLGASWQYHDFSQYSSASGGSGFQRADGSIVAGVDVPDCDSDDLSWISIDRDGHTKTGSIAMAGAQFDYYGDWIYSAYGRRKISAPDDAAWDPVGIEGTWWGTPIPAPYPVFVVDRTAGRVATTTRREYPWIVDGDHAQMDPAGRLWTIACGRLWIAMKDRASGACASDQVAGDSRI